MSEFRISLLISATVGSLMIAACGNKDGVETSKNAAVNVTLLDQTKACQSSDLIPPAQCKRGQKVIFLPQTFGNEQLPVMFSVLNCDFRYSVVVTRGAVACIYEPINREDKSSSATEKPEPTSSKAGGDNGKN